MNTAISTNAGLNLVSTTSLSAASNCIFTSLSSGARYRISGTVRGSATADLYVRFRESSTDKTASYFMYHWGMAGLASPSAYSFYTTDAANISTLGSQATNKLSYFNLDVYIHTDGTAAYLNGISSSGDSAAANSPRQLSVGGGNVSMTACNGVDIYPSTGTFTGSVSLYKYLS